MTSQDNPPGINLEPSVDSDNQTYQCNVLYTNRSHFQLLPGTFGGIPETFLLSFVSWIILLLLFSFLRKRAWDYGRLALVQKNEQRWMLFFYGDNPDRDQAASDSVDASLHRDKGFCSWIKAILCLNDNQILQKNGSDAVRYLSFQRHILLFMIIVCAICLTIVLPVNMQGTLEAEGDFGRTTLSNLEPESQWLWLHVIFSCLIMVLAYLIMRHFLAIRYLNDELLLSRTLMITKIPKNVCDVSNLLEYFREQHSTCPIVDIDIAYDVRKLSELYYRKEATAHARIYCEFHFKEKKVTPLMTPHQCGRICIFCGKCPKVDALEFYTSEEIALAEEVERERNESLTKPLGIAFITFGHESIAETVYKDLKKKFEVRNSDESRLLSNMKPQDWVVEFAPPPQDIFWEHLSSSTKWWYFRAAVLNLALFLLFIFLTTPTVVLSYLDYADLIFWKKLDERNSILSDFLSTLLLLVISVLLPVILRISDKFMCYWTRSNRNHSIMVKIYVFLLFMVIILPLLQLTSVKALLVWTSQGDTYRWKCVFMTGNGAFFVNYVITASLIGSALELIRFPDLLIYLYHMCVSRSVAEQAGLRQAVLWEFEFGVQYAWFLLMFSVIIIHCLFVPMIAPFGLLCLTMKYLVDRYNIYFVYMPSKINQNILKAALAFIVIAFILMQLCIFFFLFVRSGWTSMSITAICICIFTTVFFICQVSFHWFQFLSPVTFKTLSRKFSGNNMEEHDKLPSPANRQRYMPKFLRNYDSKEELTVPDRYYGSNEDSVPTSPEDNENCSVIKNEASTSNI